MNHLKIILSMIFEIYQSVELLLPKRPGRKPIIPDVTIMQLIILRNLLGFRHESSFLRFVQNFKLKPFFPKVSEQSRFNRRYKLLSPVMERIQFELLKRLEANSLKIRIIDTSPIPVIRLVRKNQSALVKKYHFKVGYCSAQKTFYIGLKLALRVNLDGVPTDFTLHPANRHDLVTLKRDLKQLGGLVLVGDKGFIDKKLKPRTEKLGITLITPYRKNRPERLGLNSDAKQLLRKRQLIERSINQFKDQFQLEHLCAKSLVGFKERIGQAIVTYTFGIYFNKQTHRSPLFIKSILTLISITYIY